MTEKEVTDSSDETMIQSHKLERRKSSGASAKSASAEYLRKLSLEDDSDYWTSSESRTSSEDEGTSGERRKPTRRLSSTSINSVDLMTNELIEKESSKTFEAVPHSPVQQGRSSCVVLLAEQAGK